MTTLWRVLSLSLLLLLLWGAAAAGVTLAFSGMTFSVAILIIKAAAAASLALAVVIDLRLKLRQLKRPLPVSHAPMNRVVPLEPRCVAPRQITPCCVAQDAMSLPRYAKRALVWSSAGLQGSAS